MDVDLTVPGNNDHDFYVLPAAEANSQIYDVAADEVPVLVHNCDLSARAEEIRRVIHDGSEDGGIPYKNQTVAVVRANTPNGPMNVVAANGDGLTEAQISALRDGEVQAVNDPTLHAETNAMQHIQSQPGWSLDDGGATRNVCPWCENAVRDAGGSLTGPSAWRQVVYGITQKYMPFGQRSFTFNSGSGE